MRAEIEKQALRAEIEKQALRAALDNERRDREMDQKLFGIEQARLESQVKEGGQQIRAREQIRAQQSGQPHQFLTDRGYGAHQLADLPQGASQRQIYSQAQEQSTKQAQIKWKAQSASVTSAPPPVANRPAPQLQRNSTTAWIRKARAAPTKSMEAVAVEVPEGFDSHFFIRFVNPTSAHFFLC